MANLASFNNCDLDEVRSFLEFVVGGASPNHYIAMVGINHHPTNGKKSDVHFKHFTVLELEKAINYCYELHARKWDVYCQLTQLKGVPPDGRGSKEYISGGTLLWVDKDWKKDGVPRDVALKQLKAYNPPPSWINDSGNGFHAYWKLNSFVTSTEDIESRNIALQKLLGADHCWNADRILRVPGTTNFKDLGTPIPCKFYESNDAVYNIADFQIMGSDGAIDVSVLEIVEESFDKSTIKQLPAELYKRIVFGPPPDGDRSDNDWFVCLALFEQGYTAGQILSILLASDYVVGEKAKENINYALRTIKKASIEGKRRLAHKPRALLQEIIDQIVVKDKDGVPKLVLPIQSYGLMAQACDLLASKGYRFVFDDVNKNPFIITDSGEIISATANDVRYNSWLSRTTMFTTESRAFNMFKSGIISYIMEHGQRSVLKPWSYLDLDKARYYLLLDHDRGNQICYVNAGSDAVTFGGNGTDNMLIFPSEISSGHSLVVESDLSSVDLKQTLGGLLDLTYDYFAVPTPAKEFLTCYMLAAPIAAAFVKNGMLPLLHLTGKPGQGKTECLKTLKAFIHGSTAPESGTTVPSARMIAQQDVLMPLDDYEDLDPQMKAFILTSATGAIRHKVDPSMQGVVSQRNHILIAMSSVADLPTDTLRRRALRVQVSSEVYPTKGFNSMFKEKIVRDRNLFWSGYLKFIAREILAGLSISNYYEMVELVTERIKVPEFKPHGEFIALCWFIAQRLATLDSRFIKYGSSPDCISSWLSYFGLCDQENIESYNELLGSLENVFELYLKDLSTGGIRNRRIDMVTPGEGTACQGSLWMQGLWVEMPGKSIPSNTPFDPMHTITVAGKARAWIDTLIKLGNRDYFSSMANPPVQFFAQLKNLAGIINSAKDMATIEYKKKQYTGIFRLGTSGLYLQFIYPTGQRRNPLIRMFLECGKEQYTIPIKAGDNGKGTTQIAARTRKSYNNLVAEIKKKLASGDPIGKDDALLMMKALEMYNEKLEKSKAEHPVDLLERESEHKGDIDK